MIERRFRHCAMGQTEMIKGHSLFSRRGGQEQALLAPPRDNTASPLGATIAVTPTVSPTLTAVNGFAWPSRLNSSRPRRQKRSLIERWNRRMIANAVRAARSHLFCGQPQKAQRLLMFLRTLAPNFWAVELLLARASQWAQDSYITERAVHAALTELPTNAYWACRAADFQRWLGLLEGADRTLSSARQRFPTSWIVWSCLGVLYSEKSELNEALNCFQRATELAPTTRVRAAVMFKLADCLDERTRKDEALSLYRKIVDLRPDETLAHSRLVDCQDELDSTCEYARSLVALLRSRSLIPCERQHLHYALGHLYDRSRRPSDAFAHFHLANEIRATTCGESWSLAEIQTGVDARIEVFQRQLIAGLGKYGRNDESPIFVVGMPRSGTTLVEQILSSHSEVHGLGEREDIDRVARSLHWELKTKTPYPWCVKDLSPETVRALSGRLAAQFRKSAGSCLRFVTKRPEDFWDLGLIAVLFPRARIIHCRRHPIDTCLSCYMQNFARVPYATRLDHLAEVYRLYRRIMEHWRDTLPAASTFDLSYEEIVKRPEDVARQLCEFCELPFEESCLQFYESRRRVGTASRWQVRKPVYNTSVRRWEGYAEFLGPLLALDEPQVEGSDNACEPGGDVRS